MSQALPDGIEDAIHQYGDCVETMTRTLSRETITEHRENLARLHRVIAAATFSAEERDAIRELARLALTDRREAETADLSASLRKDQYVVRSIPDATLRKLAGDGE